MQQPTRLSFFLALLITAAFACLHVQTDGGSFEGVPSDTLFVSLTVGSLVSMAVMLLPAAAECLMRRGSLRPLFSAEAFRAVPPRKSIGSLLAAFAVLLAAALMLLCLLPPESEQDIAKALRALTGPQKAAMGICLCVLTPFTEELLFRGILMHGFPQRVAVPASALCFALAHGIGATCYPLFLIGLLLALEVRRTGSLWSAMLLHGLFNLTNLLLL